MWLINTNGLNAESKVQVLVSVLVWAPLYRLEIESGANQAYNLTLALKRALGSECVGSRTNPPVQVEKPLRTQGQHTNGLRSTTHT